MNVLTLMIFYLILYVIYDLAWTKYNYGKPDIYATPKIGDEGYWGFQIIRLIVVTIVGLAIINIL